MSDQFGPQRPFGVTIVAALMFVAGAFDVLGGLLLLPLQADPDVAALFGGAAVLVTLAVLETLLGIVSLLIGFGLLRGNPIARIAATVVQAISLAMSLWIGITQPSTLVTEIVSALIALAILMLLWSRESTRFFRGLAPGEPTS